MRIGIDGHILGRGKGGVERVLKSTVELVPRLLPDIEFVVFVNRDYRPPEGPTNLSFRPLPISHPIAQRLYYLPVLARRHRLDWLHVQRAAPLYLRSTRLILHTHDLLPLTCPADHRGTNDRIVRWTTRSSIARADRILTVSRTVADEIARLFPSSVGKLHCIYNGVDTELFQRKQAGASRPEILQRLGVASNYGLYLGALMERKNLEVALHGFADFLKASGTKTNLILAGMCRSPVYEERLKQLAAERAPGRIFFTGYVSDQECVELLQNASWCLAPSRGEGFDLPALEAMACGLPVVASDLPVHRELLGDDALYFDRADAAALRDALLTLTRDPRLTADLAQRGPLRAGRFTWPEHADQMATFYRSCFTPARS